MNLFKTTTGTGEDLVIIHGACATHEDMLPIIEALSSHYKVTTVDCPGMGKSDWNPKIQTVHDTADIILADMPDRAIYIGWSFGGQICQSIAARYPKRVKRIIGIGTTPKFIADTDWIGFPQPGYTDLMVPAVEASGLRAILTAYYENEFANIDKAKSALYPKLQEICQHRPNTPAEIVRNITQLCDSTDLRSALKTITCPIDFIIGDQDANVPKPAWEKIKTLNRNIRIHEIKNAEHAPFWTHPEEFNHILKKILQP